LTTNEIFSDGINMALPLCFQRRIHVVRRCFLAFLLALLPAAALAQTAGKAVALKGTDFFRTTLWSPQLFDSKNFSFEFWFNAESPGVLVSETDTANVAFWEIAFAEIFAGGVIKAGAPNVPTMTVGTVSFGTWNHLAVVYNQTNQTLYAYLNGALANTSVGDRRIPSDNQRQAVYPFGRGGPGNLGGGNWFSGKFDEVRIWRTAIDAAQVANYWNRVLTTDLPGLMALWHFDTTSGALSPDSRIAGNNPALYVPETTTPLVDSTAPLLGQAPVVLTKAGVVTGSSAQIGGAANPQGSPMGVFFQWGTTTTYGNTTTTNSIGSGNVEVSFAETLNNLTPGTYHFRAVGVSGNSNIYGPDQVFTVAVPSVSTQNAAVTGNAVQLNGVSNPHSFATSVFIEWGTSTSYGNSTPAKDIGSGSTDITFSETISNLNPGTYNYRAVATYIGGRTNAVNATFTILPPSVQTGEALATNSSAKLQGVANPQGIAATVFFEWGTSISYGNTTAAQSIGAGATPANFSETLSDLTPGEYHFRAVLTNATRVIPGSDQVFTIAGAGGFAARLGGTNYIRTTIWSHEIFDDEDFTIELWFNATGPGILINEPDTADTALWDYAFAEVFPGGVIKAGVPGVPTFTVGTVQFGSWHHLAVVYDGSAKLLSAYLDGQPAGSSPGDRNTPKEINRTSIYCFGRGGQTNLGGGNWFTGLMDEIRIWRRPLTAQEIATQFNKILNVTEPSLMANWHLDTLLQPPYFSPDSSGKNNSAWHVPQTTFTLTPSTAPVMPDLRPIIMTNIARAIAPFAVEFEGSVNARGTNTLVYFEYGRSNVFQRTAAQDIGAGNVPIKFTDVVSGLELGAIYDFRLVASNAFGVVQSSLGTFTATGWAGHAYRLAPNDYLRTTNNQNAKFPDKNITVELWFFPTKAGVLASETAFSAIYDRAILEIIPSGNVQAGFNGLTPISVGDAVFDQWNHVALRYNATTQTMDAFLNGVHSATRTGARITPAERGVQGQFAFGRSALTKLGTGEFFGGDLDEIRVWNVARNNDDLTSARFNLLAGDEPGLVLYWRGNPTATDPIADLSPNNNFGINVGAEVVLSSAPLVYNVRRLTPTQIEAQFVVKGGSTYKLETTTDFQTWTAVSTNTAPASGYVRLPISIENEPGPRFFRVVPN
jgi:hypothetical protein